MLEHVLIIQSVFYNKLCWSTCLTVLKFKIYKITTCAIGCLLKVSEYPFKQNKNILKDMTVLLKTYFYNISWNVLRPTFFSIYNLPFLRSPSIGKIRVKVGPKTNYFSYILNSCTNRIAVSVIFFHWYVANQGTNKTVPAIFFFPNIFWIIYF